MSIAVQPTILLQWGVPSVSKLLHREMTPPLWEDGAIMGRRAKDAKRAFNGVESQLPPHQRRKPEERAELSVTVRHTHCVLRARKELLHSLLPNEPKECTYSPLSLATRVSQRLTGLGALLSGARGSIFHRFEGYEGEPRGGVPLVRAQGAQTEERGGDHPQPLSQRCH